MMRSTMHRFHRAVGHPDKRGNHNAKFMKRLFPYTGFILAIVAAGVWMSAHGPATSAGLPGCSLAAAEAESQAKPATPAEQYQTLLKEFSTASQMYWRATTDEERNKSVARAEPLPLTLLDLVENNPKDPIALDALVQVAMQEYWLNNHTSHQGWGKDSRQARAIALLLRDHLDSDKLGEACNRIHYGFRQECETFLRAVLEKSPHREVQGLACLRLAQFLLGRLDKVGLFKDQPELLGRYEVLYSKDYIEALQRQDQVKVLKEAETFYERAIEKYPDVKTPYEGTVGEAAKTELFEIRHLAVGKEAPDIEGVDQDGQQFKLSDYRGKVVLLYFWSEF
jgi:AhpC/TSA family